MPLPRRSPPRGVAVLPLLAILLAAGFLWLQRDSILGWFGEFLVESHPPSRADAIIVLAGGGQGERILKAAELLQAGHAALVVVSDAMPIYEQSECELAVGMAVRHGARREAFLCAAQGARSTEDEARLMAPLLREKRVRRYLLVTTEFHTRRAARLFRKATPELEVIPVAAPSVDFSIRRWYAAREGRKTVFLEWLKTIFSLTGAS